MRCRLLPLVSGDGSLTLPVLSDLDAEKLWECNASRTPSSGHEVVRGHALVTHVCLISRFLTIKQVIGWLSHFRNIIRSIIIRIRIRLELELECLHTC